MEAVDERQRKSAERKGRIRRPLPEAEPTPAATAGDRWRWDLHKAFVPWVPLLPRREVAVWLALWNRSPHRRASFVVGGTTLGRDAGIRRNHASAAAASLERRGFVEVVSRGNGKTGDANRYRLPELLPAPPPSPADGTRASPAGGRNLVPPPGHQQT